MHTFPATTPGHCLNADTLSCRSPKIIAAELWRALSLVTAVLLTTLLLGACSTVRLAYSQAPTLGYWWIDSFVDLSDGQSVGLRQDIDDFFEWHAREELPAYAERLQQWQTLAMSDSNPDLACSQFTVLQQAYLRAIDRSVEPLARLAGQLTPAQWSHLQRHQGKSNRAFEGDWLNISQKARQERLLDKALDRYESLYGDLTPAQIDTLRARVQRSSFDPKRVQAERLRRQTDLLGSLKAAKADPPQASKNLRAWHDRVMQSPTPGFPAYSQQLIREGCEQFAALHNTTSAKQRLHAVGVLKGYEADLRSIFGQP
ncbi:DUF6279 family lipoprotein [Hydrogenophaga sp. PAMC20947]|uniref:DUF6279 family lipoprotein n=1 Tax=Hydrogenophaga sp. PAMC20947 TaxID=2565558 RepID=UPI00109D85FC|nr:DUF6279 family lipoprotein [Hydrogenophaga sp. PAMC20947]QCB46965.1 hypothetical protein E5678_13600 [Hydrogenophaga sp. PAMC20947]